MVKRVGEGGEVVADTAAHGDGDLLAARLQGATARRQRTRHHPPQPHRHVASTTASARIDDHINVLVARVGTQNVIFTNERTPVRTQCFTKDASRVKHGCYC